jgi:hypothetical protein
MTSTSLLAKVLERRCISVTSNDSRARRPPNHTVQRLARDRGMRGALAPIWYDRFREPFGPTFLWLSRSRPTLSNHNCHVESLRGHHLRSLTHLLRHPSQPSLK